MERIHALEKIKTLDPARDHWEIVKLSAFYEFPWDFTRALEFALFRTFAVPSISAILYRSREFEKRTQKRYDDTDLILSEILEHGLQSERAQASLKKMNYIHAHFNIPNSDYLYVLSTFIFEPERWIRKYGHRQLTANEKLAGFNVWCEIGAAMGIKDIPTTIEAFEQYNISYEKQHFVYSDNNHAVATYTADMFLGWFLPRRLLWLGRPFICALMDEPLLKAVGMQKPNALVQTLVNTVFAVRKVIRRMLPQRQKPALRTTIPRPQTYPHGYKVDELGSIPYK
jgi:hypothetical protein